MTDLNAMKAAAQAAMAAAQTEIEKGGGLPDYGERPEWDLSREYRGEIADVTVTAEQGKTPRLVLVVSATEPAEFSTSRAWLTYWLSEKAMPYSMKELTPIFMKAGVPASEVDIFDAAKLVEQLVGQSVLFSMKAGRQPEYPERRFVNPDRGQTPKGPGYFKKDLVSDQSEPLPVAGGAPEPFPIAAAAVAPVAAPAAVAGVVPVVAVAPVQAPAAAAAPVAAPVVETVVQTTAPAGVVITDVQPAPVEQPVAPSTVPEAQTAPVGTGVAPVVLPPGLD